MRLIKIFFQCDNSLNTIITPVNKIVNHIMIDQTRITNITNSISNSLTSAKSINEDFKLLENLLPDSAVDSLKELVNNTSLTWNAVPLQERLPRRSINWLADSIIEELHIACDQLTPLVNQLFTESNKRFQGLQLWHDQGGYKLSPHKDNPVIDIAIQIYLFDTAGEYGTSFDVDKEIVVVPFKHNSGYILHKVSDDQRILHWTTNPLPAGIDRYSLYLTWSSYGKQAPDATNFIGQM